MRQLDFRRGMARLGFFTLAVWEILAVGGTIIMVRQEHLAGWELIFFFLLYAALIPGLIWLLWRTLLWIVLGFFRETAP